MTTFAARPSWLHELAWVLATALLATIITIVDLKLWKMDADVPLFGADGDAGYYLATVKNVVENGWFWHNPDLGAPFGQDSYDFAAPFGDVAHYVIVAALGLVLGDPVHVFNAFFLVCFPLIAVVAYAVLRDLGASRVAALVAALLFTFLPYHLLRHQGHLFLTSYYSIPLGLWLVVTLAEGRTLLARHAPRRRLIAVVGACVVVGAASNYYAIFALLLLATVVPIAALAQRSWSVARQGAAVTAVVLASFALCHSPPVVYPLLHGANETVGARAPAESELYALSLAHMVFPRPTHRIEAMALRGQAYELSSRLPRGEGFTSAIGVVATLGLAIALVVLLATGLGGAASARRRRIAAAGAAALVAFVVGTMGGGSTLIAYELTAQLRAWNRLSLVIAFAALLTIALVLTALGDRLRARGRPGWVLGVLAAAVGVVGILDQTSPADDPDYAAIGAAWRVDEAFVATMEKRLPANTKVAQLPYMSYPESGPVYGMADYDAGKGYLHSNDLRWSYGAVRGRPTDWMSQHQQLAPERLAAAAAASGFGAVYVDRAGYADGGTAVAAALDKLAGPGNSSLSANGRLQFFDLRPAAARLADRTGRSERTQLATALVRPVMLGFGSGFAKPLFSEGSFRWAGPDARLTLDNPSGPRTVRFVAQLYGGAATPSAVTLTLPDGRRRQFAVTNQGLVLDVPLVVKPGAATLRLQTDGPAAPNIEGVIRDLRLKIAGVRLEYSALRQARYVAAASP